MASLNYVGRPASLDRHALNKQDVDAKLSGGVTLEYVQNKTTELITPLATKDYADTQDGQFASKQYVDQGDGLLLPKSQRGVTSGGTVPLDATGKVPVSYFPTVGGGMIKGPYYPTSRTTRSGIADGTGNATWVAYWSIANPGFTWWPLVFGNVRFWTDRLATAVGRGSIEVRVGTSSSSGYVVANGNANHPGSTDGGGIHTAYVVPASHALGETAGGGLTGAVTVYAWARNLGDSGSTVQVDFTESIHFGLYLLRTS